MPSPTHLRNLRARQEALDSLIEATEARRQWASAQQENWAAILQSTPLHAEEACRIAERAHTKATTRLRDLDDLLKTLRTVRHLTGAQDA